MTEAHDKRECRRCGTVWSPEFTVTGRVIEHCRMPEEERVMTVEWYDGMVEIDFEQRVRETEAMYQLTAVVDPPLTVVSEKRRSIVTRGLVIFGALFIILVILFGGIGAARSTCLMSYCQEGAPERAYVRSNWNSGRRIVGDLYDPGHGRPIQIRNTSRQIIGYIENNKVLDTHRREKGTINE